MTWQLPQNSGLSVRAYSPGGPKARMLPTTAPTSARNRSQSRTFLKERLMASPNLKVFYIIVRKN